MADVSIALATHNGEEYLAAQLESLAKQTRLPTELVIVDDCSGKRTMEAIEAFAERAPFPVRLRRNDWRLGFRDSFMRAAQLCTGDLISFCDQDDIWAPNKLATIVRCFDDPDVLLAYHNAVLIDPAGKRTGRLYPISGGAKAFPPLSRHPWLVIPGFLQTFRRELVDYSALYVEARDLHWPDLPMPHDRWFVLLASVLGSIAFVGQPLAHYRQHHGNVFGAYFDRRARFDQIFGAGRFLHAASAAAANRSEILTELATGVTGERLERARHGAVFYAELQERLNARAAIYEAASYGARLNALSDLYRSGAYGRALGSGRFTGWDLLMDACVAATLGPRLDRLLPGQKPPN
jgi:glycosyltransferase involved in cell wall biosynthesis